MTRGKWMASTLACVVLGVLLGVVLVNGNPVPVFTLPTLAPTLSPPTLLPATPNPVSSPPSSTNTPVPSKVAGLAPTPNPPATFTPSPTATPAETPTPTPTPFSLDAPVLVSVTPMLTDTTAVPTPVPVAEMAPGTINIVVLGSDRRPDWSEWHTDAVHIVSIQPAMPAVTVLSIP
ncbi:MAG: hypothetical protein IMY86_00650, partial [Chloroflexi bacterium]|nr:hypothetical protein [Chloroflexota bacterium]